MHPESLQKNVDQLREHLHTGRLRDAESLAQVLIADFPREPVGWNALVAINARRGDKLATLSAANEAATRFPENLNALTNLANAQLELGMYEEASDIYGKLINLSPRDKNFYYSLSATLMAQNRTGDALKALERCIRLHPTDSKAFVKRGSILLSLEKFHEAQKSFEEAIHLTPEDADALNALGVALAEQKKLDLARQNFQLAVKISSEQNVYNEAHRNLATTLVELGQFAAAETQLKKAITLKPKDHRLHADLANTLDKRGLKLEALLTYAKSVSIDSANPEAWNGVGITLKNASFTEHNPIVDSLIIELLNKGKFVRPQDISFAVSSLIKCNPVFQNLVSDNLRKEPTDKAGIVIRQVHKLSLLLEFMRVSPISDLTIEEYLIDLRSYLLRAVNSLTDSATDLEVLTALSLQCFTNEYLYPTTDLEVSTIENIADQIEKEVSQGATPSQPTLLLLACFQPLHTFSWASEIEASPAIKEVIKRQILEPAIEQNLKAHVERLQPVEDITSRKVREQYEENPYPRWITLRLEPKPHTVSKIVDRLKLRLLDNKILEVKNPQILIAGCGTGQQSIGESQRFRNSQVTAIDLSLTSLAYAQRKTEELGIRNIRYVQADILDSKKLNSNFDIIESSGVLHHMHDPMEGWTALTECLSSGGLMKIALYSERARAHIVEIRKEIYEKQIEATRQGMLNYREAIISSDQKHHQKIIGSRDFFSTSPLRDLLFHVQEHRFTLCQIKESLETLGLTFCGFESTEITRAYIKINMNEDDLYDLDKWDSYEQTHPETFAGMYQFWCQKI